MGCKVTIQPTALRELEEAVSYLSGFGRNTASSFLDEWEETLKSLQSGTIVHRLSRFETLARLGYHTVLIKGFIVLYFKENNNIVIAHLFHQSQDYANLV